MLGSVGAVPRPAKFTVALLIVPVVATDIVTVVPEILDTLAPEPILVPVIYIPATIPAALAKPVSEVAPLDAEPVVEIVVLPFISMTVVPLYTLAKLASSVKIMRSSLVVKLYFSKR